MTKDPIPRTDAAFNNWLIPISAFVTANVVPLGVSPAAAAAVAAITTTWSTDYATAEDPLTRNHITINKKTATRKAAVKLLRPMIKQIQANPAVTDGMRLAMGLNIPSNTRTPVAVPTTAPVLSVDFGTRLMHILSFRDITTPNSRARPHGVVGCEIWYKIGGPAPVDNSNMTYVTTQPHTPGTISFEGAQAGQTVYYLARWVNSRGEKGPWSAVASGVIAG